MFDFCEPVDVEFFSYCASTESNTEFAINKFLIITLLSTTNIGEYLSLSNKKRGKHPLIYSIKTSTKFNYFYYSLS